mgnify:CR=1 FL=1
MTKHVRKQKNWQQSMAILLYIRLMIRVHGQGSIAMEIVKELPTVDTILVPVGGGGLSTGVSTLAKMLNPKIKVIGDRTGRGKLSPGIFKGRSSGNT